ncbi:hypothetical protein R84865_002256 [Carnimonas sp. R-84865]
MRWPRASSGKVSLLQLFPPQMHLSLAVKRVLSGEGVSIQCWHAIPPKRDEGRRCRSLASALGAMPAASAYRKTNGKQGR